MKWIIDRPPPKGRSPAAPHRSKPARPKTKAPARPRTAPQPKPRRPPSDAAAPPKPSAPKPAAAHTESPPDDQVRDFLEAERSEFVLHRESTLERLERREAHLSGQLEARQRDAEGRGFVGLRKDRALRSELARVREQIAGCRGLADPDREFGAIVRPYMQECAQEEQAYRMEYNAPRDDPSADPKVPPAVKLASRVKHILDECRSELSDDKAPPVIHNEEDTCPHCDIPRVLVSALSAMVCLKCGRKETHMDSAAPFGRENDTCFHYKRINHLNESILLFQAKESTIIPNDRLDDIMQTLYESGHTDASEITRASLRKALRKLRLSKRYENEAQLIYLVTGQKPPQMTSAQEERVRQRFFAIQGPFRKWCPAERKNFFSYQYVLYKISDMEGWTQFLPYFRLHKGADKRRYLDKIWKNICSELDGQDPTMPWPYKDTPPPNGKKTAYYV